MKKIVTTIIMLTFLLSLTACGSGEVKSLKYDPATIQEQCKAIYTEMSSNYSDEDIASLSEMNDYDLADCASQIYSEYKIRVDGDTWNEGIFSFRNAKEELGSVTASGKDAVIEAKGDELICTYELYGSSHNGSIEIIYDKNLHITSITTNVKNTLSECMKKAGVNTMIGMGTVFVMLIVIMVIIILLGAICKAIEKSANKEEKTSDSMDKTIENIVAREEASDDTELVAVIAAAIASYEGTSTDGFVVRSVKRIR